MGEFLLFLAVLAISIEGRTLADILMGMLVLLSLGVIGTGSVACFTRLWGIVFLGEPRKGYGEQEACRAKAGKYKRLNVEPGSFPFTSWEG